MKREMSHPITKALFPLIAGICFHKDVLEVSDNASPDKLSIFIVPHMADYPVLSGSGGRQIRALRYIVKHAAVVAQFRLSEVHLDESYIGEREPSRAFRSNPQFDEKGSLQVLSGIMNLLWINQAFRVERGEKLHVYIEPRGGEDVSLISALGDLFYCYGMRNGRKIEVHKDLSPNIENVKRENYALRSGKIPGGEREPAR